jgi:hypothetical protein
MNCRKLTNRLLGSRMPRTARIQYPGGEIRDSRPMAQTRFRDRLLLFAIVISTCSAGLFENTLAAEKFRPSVTSRPATTIKVQNEVGSTFTIKARRVGEAIVYQDDIIIAETQVQEASGTRQFRRWKDGIISFKIEANHPYRTEILNAIENLNRNTVLWYREATDVGSKYISIIHGDGCYSGIGYPPPPPFHFGDSYDVSIGVDSMGNNCASEGVIIHELLHAAGLQHEQNRRDRDKYVQIYWNNIKPEEQHNFEIGHWLTFKDIGNYNYASVMHYACNDFRRPHTNKTIDAKPPGSASFGQRTGLSRGDVDAIAAMYYDVSPNRGKPVLTPTALPLLSYSTCSTPQPSPPTPGQCRKMKKEVARVQSGSNSILLQKRLDRLKEELKRCLEDQFDWTAKPVSGSQIISETPVLLRNVTEDKCFSYGEREYGINLVWGNCTNPNVTFVREAGPGSIHYGELVAMRITNADASNPKVGNGYLRYQKREYGINLVWSNTPVYEWILRSPDGPQLDGKVVDPNLRVGLWNEVEPDFLLYCERSKGINLRWKTDCS